MTFAQMRYREFLQSKFWQDLAAEQKRRQPWCAKCGRNWRLQAAHIRYPARWRDTTLDDLVTLCDDCHEAEARALGHGKWKKPASVSAA